MRNNIEKKIFACLLIFLFTISCNKNDLKGRFYEKSNQTIFEFKSNELLVYNLLDSVEEKYHITVHQDKIISNNEVLFSYRKNRDSLNLFDSTGDNIQSLSKIEISSEDNNINNLDNNFWITRPDNKNLIIIKTLSNENTAYIYVKQSNKTNITNYQKVYLNKFDYFNKFHVYHFQSSIFPDAYYLLQKVTKDSLFLFDLNTSNKLKYWKYKSKENPLLYGTWIKTVGGDKLPYIIPDKGNLIHFGDTISINDKREFIIHKEPNLEKTKFNFQFGIDSKNIIIDSMEYGELWIVNVTKDTLILENPFMTGKDGKLLMLFHRVYQ